MSEEFIKEYNKEETGFLVNSLEAVLFAAGDPVEKERLCELFSVSESRLSEIAGMLEKKLAGIDTSYELVRINDSYQLCTKIAYAKYVTEFLKIKRTAPLSKPALEALAIIAYKQPATKSYVEKVRGVDCSGIMSTLIQRGLIEESGRLDAPGKPILYVTTEAFLRSFGLSSLSELPAIEEGVQITLEQLRENI